MAQLTRSPRDPRVYALDGVGTLRLAGRAARTATLEARGISWQITSRRIWQPVVQAADPAGVVVGQFRGRTLDGACALQWSGRKLKLRRDTSGRMQYALVDRDRTVATIQHGGWDDRPLNITLEAGATVDPELVLFAAFVVGSALRGWRTR